MRSLEIFAPAKINLSLNVLSKRDDGYHEISSVMQAIELFDKVSVNVQANDIANEIIIKTDNSQLTVGPDNIAYKAANLMLDRFAPFSFQTITIEIEKRIPMAAGLAGGSSDGAAVMLALAELWGATVSLSELALLGSKIGADVSFCVVACAASNKELSFANDESAKTVALAEGIGERLTSKQSGKRNRVLLVKPKIEVSTPRVYGLVDAYGSAKSDIALCEAVEKNDEIGIFANMNNDLEKYTTKEYPIVADTIEKMKQFCLDARVMMSGSGPTVFAYFSNQLQSEKAYEIAVKLFSDMEVFLVSTC